MKKPTTAAASVVAQAKARASSSPVNLIPLANANRTIAAGPQYSRVDQTPDPKTGASRLRVVILGEKQPEVYDLSSLLVQPQLALFLAEGFRCWAEGLKQVSRDHVVRVLRSFSGFLQNWPAIALGEIDEVFWTAVLRWLNATKKGGQPWAIKTRQNILLCVRSCIGALLDHPMHAATAEYLYYDSGLPINPWPGAHRKNIPTKVLTPSEKDQMVWACLGEIAAINQRLRDNETILSAGRDRLDQAQSSEQNLDYRNDIAVCAAQIERLFPDRLASRKDLEKQDRSLHYAVAYCHGMRAVRQLLYPTFRDLVPFVLLLAVKTAFNPDTVLGLRWSNISKSFDGRLISIVGYKGRSLDAQDSTNESGNDEYGTPSLPIEAEPGISGGLAELLDTLQWLTSRTRTILANRDHIDRLFIGVPIKGGAVAKSFESKRGPSGDLARIIHQSHLRGISDPF